MLCFGDRRHCWTRLASHRHTRPVALRVYALARELGVTSRELRDCLWQLGQPVSSAATPLAAATEAAARACFQKQPGDAPTRPGAQRPPRPYRGDADWWDHDDPWHRCPDQVTTAEAARLSGVRPATIRAWASRGYLAAVGRQGRSPLYDPRQLAEAQDAVAARTRAGPSITPPVRLRSKDLDALVYGPEAAAIVGVAPSTIRMWVLRGRLRPVDHPGRPLFRVSDVLRAARRKR